MITRRDIAVVLTATAMAVTAIAYIVSLNNQIRTKADSTEVASIKSSLEAKATTSEVGELKGRVSALEDVRDISSIDAAKEAALADLKSAVTKAHAELADIEAKKVEILEQIIQEVDKAEDVRTLLVQVVNEKLLDSAQTDTEQSRAIDELRGELRRYGVADIFWTNDAGKTRKGLSQTLHGYKCMQIVEPADPHTWTDNFVCIKRPS